MAKHSWRVGGRRRCFIALLVAVVVASGVVGTSTAGAKVRRPTLAWDPGVEPIAHQVERLRGLEFERPVLVDLVDPDGPSSAFDSSGPPPKFLRREGRHLEALGLVQAADDYARAQLRAGGGAALGVYEPISKRIRLYRPRLDPLARLVLAHELTHALDDQHYDFTRIEERLTLRDRWTTAYSAVIEGNARRTEDRYFAHMSDREQAAVRREYRAAVAATPADVADLRSLAWSGVLADVPYTLGKELTAFAVARHGDEAAVGQLFEHPPRDEMVLVDPLAAPGRWLDLPVTLESGERPDGRASAPGAVELYLVLASRIPVVQAFDAVVAVRGVGVAYFRRDGKPCAHLELQARGGKEGAVTTALDAWVAAMESPDASRADAFGTFAATICGAATSLAPHAVRIAELALAARNRAITQADPRHASTAFLACVGHEVLDDPELVARLAATRIDAGHELPPIEDLIARARATCTTA